MNNGHLTSLVLAASVALVVVPALSACSSSEDGEDGAASADPAHVIVDINPTRHTYVVNTTVTPEAVVYNDDWDEITGVELDWSVSPDSHVNHHESDGEEDDDDDQWTVTDEGRITFEACVVDDIDGEPTSVCGQRQITSSDGDGTVILEKPLPGEQFHGDEHETITVEGIADPELVDDFVLIGDQTVEIDAEGRFSADIEPRFGINNITVRAFDGVSRDDGTATVSVLWAPAYADAGTDSDGHIHHAIHDAILLHIGQNFLDDGEPYLEISESRVVTEDLADILELVLEYVDLNDEIPDPVVDSGTFELSVPDVRIDESRIEIDSTDEGLELYGQIGALEADTTGELELSDETLDLTGGITATISLLAVMEIEKASPEEDVHAELTDFELAVENAEPDFESEEADAVFELADSMLREQLEDIILDAIGLSFVESLPDMLLDVFDSLDDIVDDQEFEIDLDIADPITVGFDGEVGQLTPVRGEGLEGFLSAELGVDAEPTFDDNLGVPLSHAELAKSPLFADSRIQLALNLSLLNAALHSLWNAGLLDLDITEQADEIAGAIDEGQAEGLLPPVAMPPAGDEPYDLLLRIGQLQLDLDWMDQQDLFGASVTVGANLSLAGNDLAIDLSDDPTIDLWLIDSSEDDPFLGPDDLLTLVEEFLWSELEEELGEGLEFTIPIPELDALEPYAPELSDMALSARMTRPLDVRDGFLVVDAAIEGELFLP